VGQWRNKKGYLKVSRNMKMKYNIQKPMVLLQLSTYIKKRFQITYWCNWRN
jgi:hypothetical protein